jgi:PKD repeat protein
VLLAGAANLTGDPGLLPLADNGGPTQTHALPVGSIALDVGNANGHLTDQRGLLRIAGAGADIGAYEAVILLTPVVTNAATTVNTQTTSGLVITKNAGSGPEVTHYRITSITGGTLYKNDGVTAINNGDFITAAEGAAGLKFTPANNSITPGRFFVQASSSATAAGLGGGTIAASISITGNVPPVITSGPLGSLGAGLNIQFFVAATDPNGDYPLTYRWDFGDGATGSGTSPSHLYTAAGVYTVMVTVTDATGLSTTGTCTITVGLTGPTHAFALKSPNPKIKLNFSQPGQDSIVLKGSLPVPPNTLVGGIPLTVDVGGVIKTFTLDAGGGGEGPLGAKLTAKLVRGSRSDKPWNVKFTITLKNGNFAALLADEGLTQTPGRRMVQVPVSVQFNGTVYHQLVELTYTFTAEKGLGTTSSSGWRLVQ